MIKTSLKKPALADTSAKPVDENAADRLAEQLGVTPEDRAGTRTANVIDAEVVNEAPGAVATRTASPGSAAVTVRPVITDDGFSGEYEKTKLRLPQFKIVNGSGKLSEKYNQGAVLYADELLWKTPDFTPNAPPNPSMRFIPIAQHMQWKQNLTPEEVAAKDVMPLTVDTLDEALELGGSNVQENGQRARWSPCSRCILLLESPEGSTHSGFTIPADGKLYAPAVYYAGGMGHKEYFDILRARLAVAGRKSHETVWTMRIAKKTYNFSVFVPEIKILRDVTIGPELKEVVARVRGVPLEVAADQD